VAILHAAAVPATDLLADVKAAAPGCRFLVWSEKVSIEMVRQAFDAGLQGVLGGVTDTSVLLAALDRIAGGDLYFPHFYCTSSQLEAATLSHRQEELMGMVAQGMKNKEIAAALHLTEGSVKVYLTHVYHKLGVANRFELALLGLTRSLGPRSQPGAAITAAGQFALPGPTPHVSTEPGVAGREAKGWVRPS
jgi:DNA-binding NarL/FixJ family response regulator